jgi:hypothetical protein
VNLARGASDRRAHLYWRGGPPKFGILDGQID